MKIEYTNSREDYIKSYEKFRKMSLKSNSIQFVLYITLLIIVNWYYLYEMSIFYDVDIVTYLITPAILYTTVILAIIIRSKISKKSMNKLVDKLIELRTDAIGEKSVEIIDDKIICKGRFSENEYSIKAFDNIFEISDVLVICIQKTNPMIVIPCSAFESEDIKDEFINIIKEKSNFIK